ARSAAKLFRRRDAQARHRRVSAEGFRRAGRDNGARGGDEARKREQERAERAGKLRMDQIRTACAIAGGGPAGMMLGFLLARAGVSVVVLEKHADFLRGFRGATIHPSTLEVIYELGLLDEF